MRKNDKKIDNQLRVMLTEICETELDRTDGFAWLTHTANYSNFPSSLKIACVFDTNDELSQFTSSQSASALTSLIQKRCEALGIQFKRASEHIIYDSEERCNSQHQGNWSKRLKSL
ncbi:Fis family transcriptional regulator [Vibrio sp. 10N.261.51.F12]|uniref:Fis family transcriptional regulator n=1 Tax=Vibrio sp. 10N.261.51.F12 TaxID=3229679 RepID=UPI00354C6929